MNDQLLELIRGARRRWRTRLVLRGLAIVAVAALAAAVAASWGMDRFRFTPLSVRVFQIAAWIFLAAIAWRALGGGIRRRASDAQVALYLEEHDPALQGRLLAAVSFTGTARADVSGAMIERLVADALRECASRPALRSIERRGIATSGAVLGATVLSSALLIFIGPAFFANGARFLLPAGAEENRPYTIGVEPGDTVIARGADLGVQALLRGFTGQAELVVRRSGEESWDRLPMMAEGTQGTEGTEGNRASALVLDLRADLEYFVEAEGVRSETFTVRVADIPWTDDIAIEYRYPEYTGLAPQLQPGGDIAAIAGTVAQVIIRPTISVAGGVLVALGRDTAALVPDTGGTLRGAITVRESGEYRVLFPGPDGRLAPGSPAYAIDVLADQQPVVQFTRPGRDADATSVDEVFLEARATDDVGVRRLDLVYRVNGGPERTVPLFNGAARREVVAGHTVFLEELNLQPGDVIAYYARAADGRADTTRSLTDIYFLTIRPFDRAFREAEQQGGGGEAGVDAGELSERQRQIVAGTFRVLRDRAASTENRFREDLSTLTLAQARLREEVETLVRRLRTRGVAAADSSMATVAASLDSAVLAMGGAERELGRRAPQQALTPEQRALTFLQRAEAIFNREREVARGGQQGGGAGGGQASAEELADLFELELDRMRNQYETVERDQRGSSNAEVDETLERLRELARRQQQENERRRAQPQSGGGAAGSAGQRRMAQEAEEMARQLERLSRERQDQELEQAAQRLREAADQMRRNASSQGASGAAVLDRLREAQRELERNQSAGLRRDVEAARERAQRLDRQQEQTSREVAELGGDTTGRTARLQRLAERKNLMSQEVGALEDELERLAREAQQDQPQAAQRLREAARGVREGRLEDKIRYSRGLMQRQDEAARNFEQQIGEDIDSLSSRLGAAAEAIGESREDRIGRALERARDAANALEGIAQQQQERGRGEGQRGEGQLQQGEQGRQKGEGQGQGQGRGEQKGEGQGQGQGQTGGQPQGGQPRGGDARGAPGRGGNAMSAEERRQLDRALQEQRRELGEIRDELRREGIDTRELDGLINGIPRSADNASAAGRPQGIEALQQVIVPGLREFEFGVRRAVSGAPMTPRVGSEGQVPEAYRRLVAEYYRGLAEPNR